MRWMLMFLLLVPCVQGAVISEIMYNPAGNEFDFEYFELYGRGNIGNWSIEGAEITFPPNTTIDGYLIVARTPSSPGEDNDFFDRYGINTSYAFKGSLSNQGETLILRDEKGGIQDIVVYGDWAPENASLERGELQGYGVGAEAWEASLPGGSPGRALRNSTCDWALELVMAERAGANLSWQWRAVNLKSGMAELSLLHGIIGIDGAEVRTYSSLEEEASARFTSSAYSPSLESGGYYLWANLSVACDENLADNAVSELIFIPEPPEDPESDLSIVSAPERIVNSGSVIIEADRGNSSDDTLKAWIESDGKKITTEARLWLAPFSHGKVTIPLTPKDCVEGGGEIIAEGFGLRETRAVTLDCKKTSAAKSEEPSEQKSQETEPSGSFSFNVSEVPEEAEIGKPFTVRVDLLNGGNPLEVSVSAFVYRGSKHYSEEKNISFTLQSARTLFLPIIVEGAEAGAYRLKVRLWKEGRKTPDEQAFDLALLAPEKKNLAVEKKNEKEKISQAAAQALPLTGAAPAVDSYDTEKRPGLKTGLIIGAAALAGLALLFRKVKM